MLPNIIAIEGPDGVGKSTFCQTLKQALGGIATAQKTPPGDLFGYARLAGPSGSLGAFFAFMVGNAIASNSRTETPWTILDRYLLSTFVYHESEIMRAHIDFELVSRASHCRSPMLTVLLECPVEDIDSRLRIRGEPRTASDLTVSSRLSKSFAQSASNPSIASCVGRLLCLNNVTPQDLEANISAVVKAVTELEGCDTMISRKVQNSES